MLLEQIRDIRPGAGNGSLLSSDLANNHKALQNLCIAIIRGKKGQLKHTERDKQNLNTALYCIGLTRYKEV